MHNTSYHLVVLSHLNLIRSRKHVDEIDIGEVVVYRVDTASAGVFWEIMHDYFGGKLSLEW